MKRRNFLIAVATSLTLVLAGCSSDAGSSELSPENNTSTVVIDVRTPEEFAAGHVDGAINLNVEDPAFTTAAAALDPASTYLVYCRSGNRSAYAKQIMDEMGLTVLDGGAFTNMQDLGWPTA